MLFQTCLLLFWPSPWFGFLFCTDPDCIGFNSFRFDSVRFLSIRFFLLDFVWFDLILDLIWLIFNPITWIRFYSIQFDCPGYSLIRLDWVRFDPVWSEPFRFDQSMFRFIVTFLFLWNFQSVPILGFFEFRFWNL